jgi:two-component system NtrC family sensor kinase
VSTAPVGPEDGAGEATEVVASLRDVTDERRLVGQLVQREKLAAVGRLVGGVAHELNNPLTALLTLAELLAAEGDGAPDAGETRELARTLHAEARRAARIACRLLAFAGQRAPSRDVADVNRLLLDAVELRRYALRVQGIDIVLDLDYELPATWGDPHQLQQVFLNLVTNAEQALSLADGARRLEARTRREGERLVVAVGDTGPGMSAEEVARVLDPLYSAAPGGAGAGLGLSISEGIVREHGGTLTVDTRPGAGATFVVTLPIVEPPVQAGGGAERVDGGTARG